MKGRKGAEVFVVMMALAGGAGVVGAWLFNAPTVLSQSAIELNFVSYAAPTEAMGKIFPKFAAKWQKETGQTVKFNPSFGGSGTQTRAILDGLEADVTLLALAADTQRLEKGGLIQRGWQKRLPNNANVTRTVIALATRPNNPKNIKNWSDLARKDVKVITANPKTSGVARWNFLGLWASVSETGGSEAKAMEYVAAVYRNVPILPRDARESTDIFLKRRQGDVLLNYENELILAAQRGQRSTYVVPAVNISIETPVAVVDKYVDKRGTRKAAEAFAKYLFEPEAQREFARVGFRPTHAQVAKEFEKEYRKIDKLVTVESFGGWEAVQKKFFAEKGIFDRISASLGKR